MNKSIHPIIIFSTSTKTNSIYEVLNVDSFGLNTAQLKERYFRHIYIDDKNQLINSYDEEILPIPVDINKNKSENIKSLNNIRDTYITYIEKTLGSIYNLDNGNYAAENGFIISSPQIIILGEVDSKLLLPIVLPVLQSSVLHNSMRTSGTALVPNVHLVLLYNTKLQGTLTDHESVFHKNAFLKEIEINKSEIEFFPYIWLLDIINERSINLEDENTLNNSIIQFVDLLFTNSSNLISSVYNDSIQKNRPCIYSTFGFANICLPKEKIRNYLSKYAISSQLGTVVNCLNSKFEIITIKDEVIRFTNENEFEKINEKLSINEQGQQIFPPFSFNSDKYIVSEQEQVLSKKLSVIDSPATISITSTSSFFHDIDLAEKEYVDKNKLNFSQQLDLSKKRESEKLKNIIKDKLCRLMDVPEKGINFSLLFVAVLSNNKALVESLLEGRFTSDLINLETFQEKFRSLFTGDEILSAQSKLFEHSDKVLNNTKLIQQYSFDKEKDLASIEKLKDSSNETNPKVMELTAKVENYGVQISKLSNENDELNVIISDQTRIIESRKNEFDQDPTKESFKISRIKKIKDLLVDLKDAKIPQIDKELVIDYDQKNLIIEKRKKFIFYKLMLVPIFLSVFLTLTSFFFYQKIHEDLNLFFKSLEVSAVILVFYFIIILIQFNKLNKTFNELISQIAQRIQLKSSYLINYKENVNKLHNADFEFERDLIAFNIFSPLLAWIKTIQGEISSFKEEIDKTHKTITNETNQFSFESNSFEFSVVNKKEIENIYDSSDYVTINSNKSTFNLSDCFIDFEKTKSIDKLIEPIDASIFEIYERKFQNESLKDILFSRSKIFDNKNASAYFQKLIQTSRPLLRTEKLTSDVPYTQDIVLGFNDEEYSQYFSGIEMNKTIALQEKNSDRLGLISIKSNIPSFLIYDVPESENLFTKQVNNSNKSNYFISDEAYNYSLIPKNDSPLKNSEDNFLLSESLIFSIARGTIKFNESKNCFYNDTIGELGLSWDELIKNWNSNLCSNLKLESEEKFNSMISVFEEKDYTDFASRFKASLLSIKIMISKDFEESLSVFYFNRIKGTEDDWKEISNYYKELVKKSI